MDKKIEIITKSPLPTKEANDLMTELKRLGVVVYRELYDGHKHIDIAIPKAKINVEVDGIHHLTNPKQILADLNRGYYSHKKGYQTMHIPNEMIRFYLREISEALAEASKIREEIIQIHLD